VTDPQQTPDPEPQQEPTTPEPEVEEAPVDAGTTRIEDDAEQATPTVEEAEGGVETPEDTNGEKDGGPVG
jgi:hypothetical protein